MVKKSIQILNSSHAEQYQRLLTLAFGNATDFTAQSQSLTWSVAENHYPTLGVFHDDQLVSVMRLEWILSYHELYFKLHTELLIPGLNFPLAYLTRAGTLPEYRNSGLNSLLRYHCLKIAQGWGVEKVFGTMVEGSPRVNTLQEMGYDLVKNPTRWKNLLAAEKPALIASLDLAKNGKKAEGYLEKTLGAMVPQYTVGFSVYDIPLKDLKKSPKSA